MENIHKKEEPPIKEVLRRIRELEHAYAHLKQDTLKLKTSRVQQKCNQQKSKMVSSLRHEASPSFNNSTNGFGGATRDGGMVAQHSTFLLTESRCSNILESITQPMHITNAQGRIIYRNRAWENFYGFSGAETLGKALSELVLERKDVQIANDAIKHILNGESWAGEFPVKNKKGERFLSFGSCKPLRDENGMIVGIVSVTAVLCPQIDHQQSSPSALASKISDLAIKVKSKMKKGERHMFHQDDAPFGEISSFSREPGYPSVHGTKSYAARRYKDRDSITGEYRSLIDDWAKMHQHNHMWINDISKDQHASIVAERTQQLESSDPMSEEAIMEKVLGVSHGHNNGRSRNVSSGTSSSSVTSQAPRMYTQQEVNEMFQTQQNFNKTQVDYLASIHAALTQANIQVPQLPMFPTVHYHSLFRELEEEDDDDDDDDDEDE